MGSSARKKISRQPAKLLVAGSVGVGGRAGRNADQLVVPLVNVRAPLLRGMSKGDTVRLSYLSTRIDVAIGGGVVGEIDPRFEDAVRTTDYKRGYVHDLDRSEPAATIILGKARNAEA